MRISHRNSISSYVSKWLNCMEIKAKAEGKPSSKLKVPQPVHSLRRHELNVCLMLELLNESLLSIESTLNKNIEDFDYDVYFRAIAFLDSIYLFSRMLLDSAAGVLRHFYNCNNQGYKIKESFNDLYKDVIKGKLPNNLNKLFTECDTWFPQFRDRRDDIVHRYETNLIGIDKNSNGGMSFMQLSTKTKRETEKIDDLRSYIGMVMAGYQCFVDGLLDYWDKKFLVCYKTSFSRSSTTFIGRSANILWWASEYGEYKNDSMIVDCVS